MEQLFIDPNRPSELEELAEKGEARWTKNSVVCENCQGSAEQYLLFNFGDGNWDPHSFCKSCGFDTWARQVDNFCNDMAWGLL